MWLKPDCFIERALTTNFVVKKRPNSSACKVLEECSWLKTFSFGITQWTKGLSLEKTAFLAPQPVAVIWNIKIPVVVWQFSELPHWCSLKWIKDIRSLINLIRFFCVYGSQNMTSCFWISLPFSQSTGKNLGMRLFAIFAALLSLQLCLILAKGQYVA